jgi:hypothetical protein
VVVILIQFNGVELVLVFQKLIVSLFLFSIRFFSFSLSLLFSRCLGSKKQRLGKTALIFTVIL